MTLWSFHARKSSMHDYSSKTANDPLSDILRGLRLDGAEYGRCEMRAPWGSHFAAQSSARFHFIGAGTAWLGVNGEWTKLGCGDAVLLPRGTEHTVASSPETEARPISEFEIKPLCEQMVDVRCDGDGTRTLMFCAGMRFNIDAMHPLLALMPDVMHAHDLNKNEPTVRPLLDAMVAEVKLDRVGSGGMLARLADVVAATLVRGWVEGGCGDTRGWIAAVRDPQIGRALAAVHLDPGKDWTVEQLAKIAGVSRSGFAQRFTGIVGQTPAHYVTQIRMHQAKQWFVRDRAPIASVANRLGYDSEASFSRAFKRVVGQPPSHFRDAPRPSGDGLIT